MDSFTGTVLRDGFQVLCVRFLSRLKLAKKYEFPCPIPDVRTVGPTDHVVGDALRKRRWRRRRIFSIGFPGVFVQEVGSCVAFLYRTASISVKIIVIALRFLF